MLNCIKGIKVLKLTATGNRGISSTYKSLTILFATMKSINLIEWGRFSFFVQLITKIKIFGDRYTFRTNRF